MNYEVRLTTEAENDLRGIFEYIAFELQSPQNAAGQLDRLEQSIMVLDQMPERFRVYEKEPWHSRNLRIMPVDNYLVFYIPNHEEHTVKVMRVMYGGRDIAKQLNRLLYPYNYVQSREIGFFLLPGEIRALFMRSCRKGVWPIADMKNNMEKLNGWLHRRIRMCIWKQWKPPGTRKRGAAKRFNKTKADRMGML